MNEWDQRIREHRVWTEMGGLGPMIDNAAAIENISPDALVGLERLRTILAYGGKRIAAADPQITALPPLDSIASALTAVRNEVAAFISDQESAHISSANVAADNALLAVSQVPGAYSPEELGALVAATLDYRTVVSDALAEAQKKLRSFKTSSEEALKALSAKIEDNTSTLSSRAAGLESSLSSVATSVEAERQKVASIVSEQQGQFSTAQDSRSESFNKLVGEYQSQFSAAQDARSKEHVAAESARLIKYNETIAEYSKKLADQDADFTKQRGVMVTDAEHNLTQLWSDYGGKAAQALLDIEDKQKHVEKLVGVIGNLGVTSGYVRAANQARWAMWGWQAATLAALITLSTLAYKTLGLLEDRGGRFSWGGFAGRALLLVSLGVIAAYSGFQADKLFADEKRNRKLALQLEAIGPYLAPLPVEDQNKFRVQMGEVSFGREPESHEHRKSPTSVLDIFKSKESKELLNLIIQAATKAKDLKP
jgi:hypothetical protein